MDQPTVPLPPTRPVEAEELAALHSWEEAPTNGENPRPAHAAPRCGARNRHGNPCRAPAMANGRCRRHGGKSTGPTADEGLKRLRLARTLHDFYGAEGRAFRSAIHALRSQARLLRLVAALRSPPSLDPDQGETPPAGPASGSCRPPT